MPDSGWPFDGTQLGPFYEEAQRICQLGPYRYDAAWWTDRGAGKPVLDTDLLATTVNQISPPTRFGELYRDELERAADVRVCLWANVVDLRVDGERISAAEVAVLHGERFRVAATTFVLAAGGIEVPRLLLASTGERPAGIGNQNDLVGRCFADHPHIDFGVVLTAPARDLSLYTFVVQELPGGGARLA